MVSSTDTVDLIIKSSTEFYNDLKVDENGRYRSWEHCYSEGSDWKLQFECVRGKMEVAGMPYPQMKMLDMGFWQVGFELDISKGIKTAH